MGDLGDAFLPGVDATLGVDAMFAAAPEAPLASSGPSVSRLSAGSEPSGAREGETDSRREAFASARETAATDADDETPESDDKKRARLVRNRESAMLSRQRKKQYVDDLERRHRLARSANGELQRLVQRLIAECEGLRHHLSLATGDPPVARGHILPHPPPPGVVMNQAPPKVAIPRVSNPAPAGDGEKKGEDARGGAPESALDPDPRRVAVAAAANESPANEHERHLVTAEGDADRSNRKRARRTKNAPGSALAAAPAAGALAVLSVACVATERRNVAARVGGGGALAVRDGLDAALAAPKQRRLLALASGETERMSARDGGSSATSDSKRLEATFSALAATRAAVGEAADAVELRFAAPDYETSDYDFDASSRARHERHDASSPFSVDDPWTAAFRAAGLRRAEGFRRTVCAETFRFKPEPGPPNTEHGAEAGDAETLTVVASDVFVARRTEAAEMDDTSETEERLKTPESTPRAIKMPAAAREANAKAVLSSASGLPAPPPRVSMGGIVDDDSSLVSVLLPPASAATKTVGSYDALSKLFVVTYSRRREEYVTYSCGTSE